MENTLIDGRYLLLADIGGGGEARVYRARDESTGDEVAVRIALRPTAQEEHQEPGATQDGWVQLLARGADPKHGAYTVFELLHGFTLGQLIQSQPLPQDEWRDFVDQSLAAVETLHAQNWIHGDINADNFFRTEAGWKLLELPFHRLTPPTGRSALFGSIYTLAPEQIDGKQPTVLTDIYSLGCLYYYAAAGEYPFTGSSSVEVALNILSGTAPSLREKAPDLPVDWSDWVMQLMARAPADRFPSLAAARQLLRVA